MEEKDSHARMENSLYALNDEIMSMLHSQKLREGRVESEQIVAWLRELYGFVQEGLGKESPFKSRD